MRDKRVIAVVDGDPIAAAPRLAGEVAELSLAATLTAETLGEVGVVLEFQHATRARA